MDQSRVVEIWNAVLGKSGSGYLIGDDVVLTAHHVVDGVRMRGSVEVRQLDPAGRTDWTAAELVWLPEAAASEISPDADGALLRITGPDWQPPVAPPVRFGRIVGRNRVPCLGLGFPDAVTRPDHARDTMPIRGHVDPLHGMKSRMTTVHVDVGIVPSRSGWRGSSGTGLLCGPHLIAVVTTEKSLAPGVLEAVPVSVLAELPGFEQTLRAHGVHFVTEEIGEASPDADDEPDYAPIAIPPPSSRHRLAVGAGGHRPPPSGGSQYPIRPGGDSGGRVPRRRTRRFHRSHRGMRSRSHRAGGGGTRRAARRSAQQRRRPGPGSAWGAHAAVPAAQ
ncbi:trypsin-like serine protease [Streptomyces sp. NPDC058299]|uniref:trypsin-like serine protease n=1 Tax=Streptomyces sp. NPDC058299 TaxID=3346435 RepID=UPI0036F19349